MMGFITRYPIPIISGLLLLTIILAVILSPVINTAIFTPFLGNQPGVIMVGTPNIYTRERLINARLRHRNWLEEQFKLTFYPEENKPNINDFNFLHFESDSSNATNIKSDLSFQKRDDDNQGQPPDSENPKAASNGTINASPISIGLPTDIKFETLRAFRNRIEHEWLKTQLDDRHDLEGNTIFQLAFDTALLTPRNTFTNSVAVIHMTLSKDQSCQGTDFCPQAARLLERWVNHTQGLVDGAIRAMTQQITVSNLPQTTERKFIDFLKSSLSVDPVTNSFLKKIGYGNDPSENSGSPLQNYIRDYRKIETRYYYGQLLGRNIGRVLGETSNAIRQHCGTSGDGQEVDIKTPETCNEWKAFIRINSSEDQESDMLHIPATVFLQRAQNVCEKYSSSTGIVNRNNPVEIFCRTNPPRISTSSQVSSLLSLLAARNSHINEAGLTVDDNNRFFPLSSENGRNAASQFHQNDNMNHDPAASANNEINPPSGLDAICIENKASRFSGLLCPYRNNGALERALDITVAAFTMKDLDNKLSKIDGNNSGASLLDLELKHCNFGACKVSVEANTYFKLRPHDFTGLLNSDSEVYTYAVVGNNVSPGLVRAKSDLNLDLSLRLAALQGQSAGLGFTQQDTTRKESAALSRNVIGYESLRPKDGKKLDQADFGWMILPPDETENLLSIPISTLVSAPSWWTSAQLVIRACWMGRKAADSFLMSNREEDKSSEFKEACNGEPTETKHVLSLPGDEKNISHKLKIQIVDEPNLQSVGITESDNNSQTVVAGKPAEIILRGARLWRNPKVFLGQQMANFVQVLPDMTGLIARFDCIANPKKFQSFTSRGNSLTASDEATLPIMVWTSEKSTEPLSVRVQPFNTLYGEMPCFVEDSDIRKRMTNIWLDNYQYIKEQNTYYPSYVKDVRDSAAEEIWEQLHKACIDENHHPDELLSCIKKFDPSYVREYFNNPPAPSANTGN